MYVKLSSFTLFGLDAIKIQVEVSISPGLPKFEVIGMADAAIKESKERIFQSIVASGYKIPPGNITINLAPAQIRKKGTIFDLVISVGILLASKQITTEMDLSKILIGGELSLNGELRHSTGIFNAGLMMKEEGFDHFIYPHENHKDLFYFRDIKKSPIKTLAELVDFLEGRHHLETPQFSEIKKKNDDEEILDYRDVYGNEVAKRALQLSVLGRLNVLLIGPPGCGKTMLLRRMTGLLPDLDEKDALLVTKIHAASEGGLEGEHICTKPPFREVHSSISEASLIGGGKTPSPGEISLSHKGILLMDEFPEFGRSSIQLLRTPVERKEINIRRVDYNCTFPSDFILCAAMNPCPCGYHGDAYKMCQCSQEQIKNYYQKISGPILDRIDIILYVDSPKKEHLFKKSDLDTKTMREELERGFSFLKSNPNYLKAENVDEVIEEKKIVQDLLGKAYEGGFISLRRLKSIVKTAMVRAIFLGKELEAEHLYFAMQLCKVKWGV